MPTKEKTEEQTNIKIDDKIKEALNYQSKIVVYNDDVNTFDHVIDCFIKYCKHEPLQAEQCALLIHHKGKCEVKSGSKKELVPIATALLDNQLSAEIE